jgi:hypothetical protein
MLAISKRFDYLFRSTKGLILVAIAVVSLTTAIWGTLSGPMVEWGIRDITVNVLGMDMVQAEREARIIMLYHTIAMTMVAIEVYMITDILPMKRYEQVIINSTITIGYLTAFIFGMLFAYWGHNFIYHGLFLLGQSLVWKKTRLTQRQKAAWTWNALRFLSWLSPRWYQLPLVQLPAHIGVMGTKPFLLRTSSAHPIKQSSKKQSSVTCILC